MRFTQQTVLVIRHKHTPNGLLDHYRFESFLSYLPIFSTFTGTRALLGTSRIETAVLLPTGGYSAICSISPCLEINEVLPRIRKDAWFELFGIKGLLIIYQAVLKVLHLVMGYFKKVCGNITPASSDIDPTKQPLLPPKTAKEELYDLLG
ncbi:conserved hypothetical protein [Chlamydia felis Fe/C-56]|uniref:Uncharacterized protein n=1 Tax=Chlamydia felis (strain Fe/C-56) TaxID=264202 RepID=Q255C0_CHLFF|nr:hypothetical protein [Chlamydia felis]BAE81118.1 conserved hypothetical protein [Chlamydia felis Fe/C-56]